MTELQNFVERLQQRLGATAKEAPQESLEAVLKGQAVELYLADGDRLFIVADEEDARLLGEPRGALYTSPEVQRVIQIGDPSTVAEVHRWKRTFAATLSEYRSDKGN